MAFKVRDLIVTVVPSQFARPGIGDCDSTSGGCDATSGGCGGTCDAGTQGTVGSCTSECGGRGGIEGCDFSDELLDPLKAIVDPPDLLELRMLLRLAIARRMGDDTSDIEAQLAPRTAADAEVLEEHMRAALGELRKMKGNLQRGA